MQKHQLCNFFNFVVFIRLFVCKINKLSPTLSTTVGVSVPAKGKATNLTTSAT